MGGISGRGIVWGTYVAAGKLGITYMAHIGDSHCISVGQHCSRVCGMRMNQ